jgi:glutamyl-tRNA reductase
VVSCTSAQHRLMSVPTLVDVIRRRSGRKLLVIDLAFPRDVDPAARGLEGLDLYDLEEVGEIVQATASLRAAAVPAVEARAGEEAERSMRWLAGLEVVPTIKGLRRHSEGAVLDALRRSELADGVGEDLLQATSEAIVTRLLHTPTRHLRKAAERGDGTVLTTSLRELFELDQSVARDSRRAA